MPYNLLLIPLLSGYLFLSLSNLRSYSVLKLGKDQLLLHASGWGLGLLILSRLICMLLLQTKFGEVTAKSLHAVAPFPFIGTALCTIAIAFMSVAISNLIVDEKAAARWLYHRGVHDPLTRILWSSFLGHATKKKAPVPTIFLLRVLAGMARELRKIAITRIDVKEIPALIRTLWLLRSVGAQLSGLPKDAPLPIMIYFKDQKVLVGYVVYIDNSSPSSEYTRVAPVWTGHRDPQSGKIVKATDYSSALVSDDLDNEALSRIVRISDISWASLFNESAFDFFATPIPSRIPMPPSNMAAHDENRAKQ